jgi:hypothetical protein
MAYHLAAMDGVAIAMAKPWRPGSEQSRPRPPPSPAKIDLPNHAMPADRYRGQPMTLANMLAQGVRSLRLPFTTGQPLLTIRTEFAARITTA